MDRDAEFREFFEAEFRPLRRLAFLLCGDWGEAEDLAQEAMVRTYQAWSRIRDRERPGAYARTVLTNRQRSLIRRAVTRARHPEAGAASAPADAGDDAIVLWEALGTLPMRQRQALVLRFYEHLPESEVAAVLGCPVGTVKSMVHRGLARLRERLADEMPVRSVPASGIAGADGPSATGEAR